MRISGRIAFSACRLRFVVPLLVPFLVTFLFADDYSQWQDSTIIDLNTGAGGAGVTGDVLNFPVLVRLDASNFDFGRAQSNGADIRFAKVDDTPLPYEIERWDSGNRRAEVWVKVDTVKGDRTTAIVMYWNNTGAIDISNSEAVFDNVDGFVGVWHMDDSYKDATVNHLDGVNNGATNVTARVATGGAFDGSSSTVEAPFPRESFSSLTVSAWVRLDNQSNWIDIVSQDISDYQGGGFGLRRSSDDKFVFVLYDGTKRELLGGETSFSDDGATWYHLTGRFDGSTMSLYMNGVEKKTMSGLSGSLVWNGEATNLTLGRLSSSNATLLSGVIDEVRVSRKARSADWIKLCHENQRQNNTLVYVGGFVCESPTITTQPTSPTTEVGNNVTLALEASGKGLTYQWQEKPSGSIDWTSITGTEAKKASYTFTPELTDNGNEYRCVVSTSCGAPSTTSNGIRLSVNSAEGSLNPVVVAGSYVDDATIQLSLTRYSSLPSVEAFDQAYVESVGVWHRAGINPDNPDPASDKRVAYSLAEMKNAGDEPFNPTLSVPSLAGAGDSLYHLCVSVFWRNYQGQDSHWAPFVSGNGDIVIMSDTSTVPMVMTMTSLEYYASDTIVRVKVNNTRAVSDDAVRMGVWYGYSDAPDFSEDDSYVTWIDMTEVKESDSYTHNIKESTFAGKSKRVYVAVTLEGRNGNLSDFLTGSVQVGRPRPENDVTLTATKINSYQVVLTWDKAKETKIWYGTSKVPLDYTISEVDFHFVTPTPGTTFDTISTLDPGTKYFFGLQIVGQGVWSFVSEASSASATTDEASSSLDVSNTIQIESAVFNPSKKNVQIAYTYDTNGFPSDPRVQIGVRHSLVLSDVTTDGRKTVYDRPSTSGTLDLWIPDVRTDTTYYIGMWMRAAGGNWAGPTGNATDSVEVPEFSWDAVKFFEEGQTEVSAADGRIILRMHEKPVSSQDTLRKYDIPSNLIDGLTPVGLAFRFENPKHFAPILVGINYDSIPSGADSSAFRMYRVDSTGSIVVEHDSYVEDSIVWVLTRTGGLKDPFLLLSDSETPRVRFDGLTDTSLALNDSEDDTVTFSLSDNISNAIWKVKYGPGDVVYQDSAGGELTAKSDTLVAPISGRLVIGNVGLRAVLIYSDGAHTDTINISRRTRMATGGITQTQIEEWAPFRVKAELDENDPTKCLQGLLGEARDWGYDKNKFRIYRWAPTIDDATDAQGWQEFAPGKEDEFTVKRGRVFWIKTSAVQTIKLDAATSTSLKDNFSITLKKRNWTDFSLPVNFSVRLSDILDATGRDKNIQIIHWEYEAARYIPEFIYAKGLSDLDGRGDTEILVNSDLFDSYSVYNKSDVDVTLVIPPLCSALSPSPVSKSRGSQGWTVLVHSVDDDSKKLGTIRCGYYPSEGPTTYHPLPPSFAKMGIGVDGGGVNLSANAIDHDESLVHTYELVFYNDRTDNTDITITLDQHGAIPVGAKARILSSESGVIEPEAKGYTVHVPAKGRAYKYLVVGNQAEIDGFASRFSRYSLKLSAGFPNPFAEYVRLSYVLPYTHVEKISFAVYDLKGGLVWRHAPKDVPGPGRHVIDWNAKTSAGVSVSAGVYVMRMTVVQSGNTTPKVFETRLTCTQ